MPRCTPPRIAASPLVFVCVAVLLFALLRPEPANSASCRLALVLGLDISISVDEGEDRLQRHGVANALLSPTWRGPFLRRQAR
jgi:hypothetical protein